MADTRSLAELLADAEGTRQICRQMCVHDGIDPDAVMTVAYGRELKNHEYHVANVAAVLRAIKDLADG